MEKGEAMPQGLGMHLFSNPRSQMSHQAGLRVLAVLEAVKGALVLGVGLGLLGLIHHDVQHLAEGLVRHFHLNPANSYPRVLLHAAQQLTDARLWGLAVAALVYALFRFAEGYGLWTQRRWAAWLGAVSAALYIPVEVWELVEGITGPKVVLLGVNVGVVWYLAMVIRQRRVEGRRDAGMTARSPRRDDT
jgi:uncharacterized membrane protein (DUF2068 family)